MDVTQVVVEITTSAQSKWNLLPEKKKMILCEMWIGERPSIRGDINAALVYDVRSENQFHIFPISQRPSEPSLNRKHIVFHLMRQPDSKCEWKCGALVRIQGKVQHSGQHGLMDYCVWKHFARANWKTFLFSDEKRGNVEKKNGMICDTLLCEERLQRKWIVYLVLTLFC